MENANCGSRGNHRCRSGKQMSIVISLEDRAKLVRQARKVPEDHPLTGVLKASLADLEAKHMRAKEAMDGRNMIAEGFAKIVRGSSLEEACAHLETFLRGKRV